MAGPIEVETSYGNFSKPFVAPAGGLLPELSIEPALPSDAVLAQRGNEYKAFKKPIYLRFEWEMNLVYHGHPKVATPAIGIANWRHAYAIIHPIAPNVQWVFNPTSAPGGDKWYPGDDVVDWIGADAYARHPQDTIYSTISGPYKEQAYHRKPFFWGEFGTVNPTVFFSTASCQEAKAKLPLLREWSAFDSTGGTGWLMDTPEIALWKACNAILES